MRFANERGLVAFVAEYFTDGLLALVELRSQRIGAVLTRVFAGEDAGAGRRAGRIRAVGALKEAAFFGESIEVGCLDLRVAAAECVPVLLVGGDEEDVEFRHMRSLSVS